MSLFDDAFGAAPAKPRQMSLFDEAFGAAPDPAAQAVFGTAKPLDAPNVADTIHAERPIDRARTRQADREAREAQAKQAAQPVDSWAETGRKALARILPNMQQSVAGTIEGLSYAGTLGNEYDTRSADEILGEFQDMAAKGKVPGQALYRAAERDLQANGYNPGDSNAKRLAGVIADSAAQMVPSILASVVSRNPVAGAGLMGAQVGGQQYGESVEAGRGPNLAAADAVFMGGAEALGEEIPLGMLMKPGGKFLGSVLKTAGAEGVQELFTQILQTGYDKLNLHPDMTWGEAKQQIIDAGIAGAVMGGGFSAVSHPINERLQQRALDRHVDQALASERGTTAAAATQAFDPNGSAPQDFAQGIRGRFTMPQARARDAPDPQPRAPLTPGDLASPIANDDIATGKAAMDQAIADAKGAATLDAAGAPAIGSRARLLGRDVEIANGFEDENGKGVTVRHANGATENVYFDDLAATGETFGPHSIDAVKARIRSAESGGNDQAKNPNSSATGRYQFTAATWAALGGDPNKRTDPAEQERLMDKLLSQNAAALRGAGIEADAGNLYLAHFLGAGGAINALSNPDAQVSAKVQAANPFAKGWTNRQLAQWAEQKMGGASGPVANFEDGTPSEGGFDPMAESLPGAPKPEEQVAALAADIPDLAAKMAEQDRQIELYHGSNNPSLTRDQIEIVRAAGQKQGKRGRVYGGFYGVDADSIADAEGYAKMGDGGSPTLYRMTLKRGALVEDKEGDITRLSEKTIADYRARGVDVVRGTDPRGRTEYAVINKDAIERLDRRNDRGKFDPTELPPPPAPAASEPSLAEKMAEQDDAIASDDDWLTADIEPTVGARPGPDYEPFFDARGRQLGWQKQGTAETAAKAEADRKEADTERRRASAQEGADKRNAARRKLIEWFDSASDGDEITDATGEVYRVFEGVSKRFGKTKTLAPVGDDGRADTINAALKRIGDRLEGGEDTTFDPQHFGQHPEHSMQSRAATLGFDLTEGKAETRRAPAAETAPSIPTIAESESPSSVTQDGVTIANTLSGGMPVSEAAAATRSATPKQDALKRLEKGQRVTLSQDVDYLSAGGTYEVESVDKKGAVYFRNVENGGGTSVPAWQVARARQAGHMQVAPAAAPQAGTSALIEQMPPRPDGKPRTNKEYLQQGWNASNAGHSLADNPYMETSTAHTEWAKGWRQGDGAKAAPEPVSKQDALKAKMTAKREPALDRQQIAQRRADHLNRGVIANDHAFAEAIHSRDFWTLREQLAPHNRSSRQTFAEATGVKLPAGKEATRKALQEWAGVSDAEVSAHDAKARASENAKRAEQSLKIARDNAQTRKIKTGDKVSKGGDWIDEQIAAGFDTLQVVKRGAVPRYFLTDGKGRGFPVDGELLTYAKAKLSEPQAAQSDEEPSEPLTDEQAAAMDGMTVDEYRQAKADTAALFQPPKPVDRSAAIVIDPAKGTVKTVPVGTQEREADTPGARHRAEAGSTREEQIAYLRAMKESGAENGEITVAAEHLDKVTLTDLYDLLGIEKPSWMKSPKVQNEGATAPREQDGGEESADFKRVWNSKAFKDAMKVLGELPHRESPVAAAMVRGWIDGQAKNLAALDKHADGPAANAAASVQNPSGFNPRDGYLEGFYAAVMGEAREIRARATGNVMGSGPAIDAIAEKIEPKAPPPEKPTASANKVFTDDAAERARAVLKKAFSGSQLNSGLDPEVALAGITLAGYHIEKGARTFAAYAKAMLDDIGPGVKPYLRSWYEAIRFDPRASEWAGEMSSAEDIGAALARLETQEEGNGGATQERGDRADDRASDEGSRPADAPSAQGDGQAGGSGERSGAAGDRDLSGRDGSSDERPAEREGEPAGDDTRAADDSGAERGGRKSARAGDRVRRTGDKPAGRAGGVDYSAPAGSLTREGSWKATAERNLDIVELVRKLDAEQRAATPEEQALLAKFTGWGASEIKNNLFRNIAVDRTTGERSITPAYYGDWVDLTKRASELLRGADLESALQSVQYAHYTSEAVIRPIWEALRGMGFTGGKVLEPGMGNGLFMVAAPKDIAQAVNYTGIELDGFTAKVAQYLLPQENALHADYVKQKLPDGFFDAAIGNPPFAATTITEDPAYRKLRLSLHDYFFAKTIDKVRPGGLMVFVTSRYTMDKLRDVGRSYLAGRADLLGAIRLPQTAFKANAGTEVVTDVLFFQKRFPGAEPGGQAWLNAVPQPQLGQGVAINEYFVAHPEMVLGRHATTGSMYRANEYTVEPLEGEIGDHIAKAIKSLPTDIYAPAVQKAVEGAKAKAWEADIRPASSKEGGLYVKGGKVLVVENGVGRPVSSLEKVSPADEAWLGSYAEIRDKVKAAQRAQLDDGDWEAALKALNKAYDAHVKKHGPIQAFTTFDRTSKDDDGNETTTTYRRFKYQRLLDLDVESPLIFGLETIKDDGTIAKGPFLLSRTLNKPVRPTIETAQDALAVTLDEVGHLDLDYAAKLLGQSREEVIDALGDGVFQTPGGEWQTADEYLSGDVVAKLEEAKVAADADQRFERNVAALFAVQPQPLAPADITVKLGAGWVPLDTVKEFAADVIGVNADTLTYEPATATWALDMKGSRSGRSAAEEWGTADRSPAEILMSVLNNQSIKVMHPKDSDGKTTENKDGTAAATEKAKQMVDRFKVWVWEDAKRAASLSELYNRKFNNLAPRRFDGSHLTLPGLSARFSLYPHQKRAIWRVIQTGNTYLAHAVGAGKTLEMIVAGMEQRRLGLIQKPMYVVPNHMLNQFAREFMEAYPAANIMVADEKSFHTDNRRRFMAQAALNNPDAIIVTHSSFGKIDTKPESRAQIVAEMIAELEAAAKDAEARHTRSKIEKQVENIKRRFEGKQATKDQSLTFEDMGVDFVFVDEAHEFRKLDYSTNRAVKGIDPVGSQRALDLYIKTRFLNQQSPGRALVLASGTPVTNTMAELYTVMRYMDSEGLERDGIASFDAWANMFGEVAEGFEQNAAGGYEMVARFAKFVNVPELMKRVRTFMDVLTSDQLGDLVQRPEVIGGGPHNEVTTPIPTLEDYMKGELAERIKRSREWKPSKDQPANPDPIIAINTDARLASIDMRFIDPTLDSDPGSKLNAMLDRIIEQAKAIRDIEFTDPKTGQKVPTKGGTQIVFSAVGFGEGAQKNRGFDLRGWVEKRLTAGGIKKAEIAWMSDANTHAKKEALFKDMRAGRVKVLFGSPKNMGTGVNVQNRLRVLHYLSPPWYPSDVEQPHGRIIRQGNWNPRIDIHWYATKGTYDSTAWGMVTRKARFIEQAMRGDDSVRKLDDISEANQYEMAAALAAGDDRVIKLAGLSGDIERLTRLQSEHASDQVRLAQNKRWIEKHALPAAKEQVETFDAAMKVRGTGYPDFALTVGGATYARQKEGGEALLRAIAQRSMEPGEVGKIAGQSIVLIEGDPVIQYGDDRKTKIGTKPSASLAVQIGPATLGVTEAMTSFEQVDPVGLSTRLLNQVRAVPNLLAEKQRALKEQQDELAKIERRLGMPFPQAAELAEKVAERAQIQGDMAAETRAAEEAAARARGEQPKQQPVGDEQLTAATADDIGDSTRSREQYGSPSAAGGTAEAPPSALPFDEEYQGGGPKRQRSSEEIDRRIQATAEQINEIRASLQQRLRDRGLDRVALEVGTNLHLGRGVAGRYYARLISVALDVTEDPTYTFDHESVHAFRALKGWTETEWNILKGWACTPARMKFVRARWTNLKGNLPALQEEAIAEAIAEFQLNRERGGTIAKLVERFLDVIDALGSAWRTVKGDYTPSGRKIARDFLEGRTGARASDGRGETGPGQKTEEPLFQTAPPAAVMSTLLDHTRDATGALRDPTKLDAAFDALDRVRTTMQDRMLPVLRAQAAAEIQLGRELKEDEQPYRAEELMTGRVGPRLEHLERNLIDPLFAAMHEEGISAGELESYLYARHAPERNARISQINPEFAPGEGSGMTDLEAKAIMARIQKAGRMDAFKRLAKRVDALRDFSVETRINAGLLSQEDADEWRKVYPNYVPLRGFAESEGGRPLDSKGISVRGKESQRAFGRRSQAADLLAHTIMQAEEAIIRAEKNRIGQQLYALARAAKDKRFWSLGKVNMRRAVNPDTGLVEQKITHELTEAEMQHSVFLKIDGKPKVVTFNHRNEAARRTAAAMRRLDDAQMNLFFATLSKVNRYLSAVNTSLNPEFVISNAFRDMQTVVANVAGLDLKGMERATLAGWPHALKAAFKGAFEKGDTSEWGRAWAEFNDEGGRVYYNQVKGLPELRKDIADRIARMSGPGVTRSPRTPAEMALIAKHDIKALGDNIEKVNLAVENAIRLAVFKAARDRGVSPAQAASIAKNISVNFNRRGTIGVAMNAMYLFYNASVQGSARILMALQHKSVRRIAYGMIAAGLALDLLNAFLSPPGDDGEDEYSKISDFDKSRNLIIMLPGTETYIKLPLPYGYNVFYSIGRAISEIGRGKDAMTVGGNLLSTIADAFNPIGGTNSIMNMLAPTIADPIVDLSRNRDFADRPIMPDQSQFGPEAPDNQRYWNSIAPFWKGVTDTLNTASGGDEVRPGAIDVSPETLEYLFGTVTGAAGATFDRAASIAAKTGQAVDGQEPEWDRNDFPLVRKVLGGKPTWYDRAAFYARIDQVETAAAQAKDYQQRGDRAGLRDMVGEERDLLEMIPVAKAARKAMREVRKERAELTVARDLGKVGDDRYRELTKRLDDAQQRVITGFNKRYLAHVEKPVGPE